MRCTREHLRFKYTRGREIMNGSTVDTEKIIIGAHWILKIPILKSTRSNNWYE
jgi:hypothetical protein